MDANSEFAETPVQCVAFDFEAVFRDQYSQIARVIARIVNNPARAEELCVDVFWRLWRHPRGHGPHAAGWLYRTAVRIALDELRKLKRREKYERLFTFGRNNPNPEQMHSEHEEHQRVHNVLASINARHAELLILRSDGLNFPEIAQILSINPVSIRTIFSRAQQAFRKEYSKRYGTKQ